MENIELNKLIEIASELKENEWHFHFLTPVCIFNESKMYKLILETKEANYYSLSQEKPTAELNKLEALFYKRTVEQY